MSIISRIKNKISSLGNGSEKTGEGAMPEPVLHQNDRYDGRVTSSTKNQFFATSGIFSGLGLIVASGFFPPPFNILSIFGGLGLMVASSKLS